MSKTKMLNPDTAEVTLETCAKKANEQHEQMLVAMRPAIGHAREAGRYLNKAKNICPHGTWTSWLKKNFHASEETARVYMRVDKRWGEIEAVMAGKKFTLEEALEFLRIGKSEDKASDSTSSSSKPLPPDDPKVVEQLNELQQGWLTFGELWMSADLSSQEQFSEWAQKESRWKGSKRDISISYEHDNVWSLVEDEVEHFREQAQFAGEMQDREDARQENLRRKWQQEGEWHEEMLSGSIDKRMKKESRELRDIAAWLELAKSEGLSEEDLRELVLRA